MAPIGAISFFVAIFLCGVFFIGFLFFELNLQQKVNVRKPSERIVSFEPPIHSILKPEKRSPSEDRSPTSILTRQSMTHLSSKAAIRTADVTETPRTIPTNTIDNIKPTNITRTPKQCYKDFLGPTRADDLAKIESYKFDSNDKYIRDMFPPSAGENKTLKFPKYPTVVCGISSNHFKEGMVMLETLNKTVLVKYKRIKVVMFDIGLKQFEIEQINAMDFVELRKFDFKKYPKHVEALHNFAWKAIITQIVAHERTFVIYMDASIRFRTNDLDSLFKEVKDNGVLVAFTGKTRTGTIAERTHIKTFEFLAEQPCTYALCGEAVGGFYMLYTNPFVIKHFLYPYVACALTLGCMEPFEGGSDRFLNCENVKERPAYHHCHRADQSVIGILYHRLFHMDLNKNRLEYKYFAVCRSTQKMC